MQEVQARRGLPVSKEGATITLVALYRLEVIMVALMVPARIEYGSCSIGVTGDGASSVE